MAGEQGNRTVLIIPADYQEVRADQALSDLLQISRNQIQKLIKSGQVTVSGAKIKAKDPVLAGEEYVVEGLASKEEPKLSPSPMKLDIVYEDEHLLVLNKSAGLVVHPGAGTTEPTLIEGVLHHLGQDPQELPGDVARPGIVHRLDKDTSGAMVVAKSDLAHRLLAEQFKNKSNLREYLAILRGRMTEDRVEYESYLYRDPRHRTKYATMDVDSYHALENPDEGSYRYAKSTFLRKKTYGNQVTVAQVRLHTGRTHQIRVHAKALGAPIVGDETYGNLGRWSQQLPTKVTGKLQAVKRQMLHARLLGFVHPVSQEKLGFEVPIPDDMKEVIFCLEEHLV